MCEQDYNMYTCGCRQNEELRQCRARRGTNEKCARVTSHKSVIFRTCAGLAKIGCIDEHRAWERKGAIREDVKCFRKNLSQKHIEIFCSSSLANQASSLLFGNAQK